MGSQGPGRKRTPSKNGLTAEEDALNVIAKEAEARLAAKRAARAEAREIRMRELERQQKEIYQVQKKYYGLDNLDNKWGDIEQWMEDSERYTRVSRRHASVSDDEERMSVGSRSNIRLDLDAAGAYGGLPQASSYHSHKKSKKKKKHSSKTSNGYDDDLSPLSSRSSRISDESKISRSSRLDRQSKACYSSELYSSSSYSSKHQAPSYNGYQLSLLHSRKHRGSVYEDSLYSGSRRSCARASSEYSGFLGSSSRTSSRANSASGSPVEDCSSSVASFMRSSASISALSKDLDRVVIPDLPSVNGRLSMADDRLERDYLEKGSSRSSTISGATLTSLGGTSSRRGSGDTSISADTEASIREIKEIHELKDQIQDVEAKHMQNLKELKDSLLEVEEKYRKAMVSNAQLDNEKTNMMYEVDTLKDSLMELEEMLFETRRELEEKCKDLEREKHAHSILQFQFSELKETLKQSEELLTKHGIVLGPDLATNGETEEEVGTADQNSQTASAEIREGSSVLEIRLRKLVDERENLIEQVKRLKGQLEQKKPKNGMEDSSSPEGDVLENGGDSNIMDIQRDANRHVNDLKFKLVKSEQEVTALEQNVTRLEGHVTRYKAASENAEKVEDELKAEKRKLQRELRSALDKIEELESSNSHLSKRLEKMKSGRGTATTP
ncbi:leucine-rich repeat flightless-interacting protein 2 isoform X24 [Onychostoma macrolepis]|uniref:leucine-rich repeat flightless-interacting protein 2 isoform X24 n=1 Tax=Onychostoma macrolepis TaxID=369639 RepID=UPI00272AD276|nr:leucine-rich repeat flightless-interacting protein 2 isoform X24 [Onychostoma macrolepis]